MLEMEINQVGERQSEASTLACFYAGRVRDCPSYQ